MTIIIDGTGTISGVSANGGISSAQSGSVIQTVSSSSITSLSSSGVGYFQTQTLNITPKFSTSKILIITTGCAYSTSSNNNIYGTLYRNATNLELNGRGFVQINNAVTSTGYSMAMSYLDSPATTSAITYSVYIKNTTNNGVLFYNTDGAGATITLMEIAV
jgi:hypothetical protein